MSEIEKKRCYNEKSLDSYKSYTCLRKKIVGTEVDVTVVAANVPGTAPTVTVAVNTVNAVLLLLMFLMVLALVVPLPKHNAACYCCVVLVGSTI